MKIARVIPLFKNGDNKEFTNYRPVSLLAHQSAKLEFYGVRGLALNWFQSYLTDRKQYVLYNNVQSQTLDITCGVPQGSVLGPLLFLIYVNDIANCLTHSKLISFADYTTVFLSSRCIDDLYKI